MSGSDSKESRDRHGFVEPICVRMPDAMRMTGLSRSSLYKLIAAGELEIAKVGRTTVIMVASLKALINSKKRRRP